MKKILILNWKCIKHPQAGGAEIVTHEIAKRMVLNGDEVTMIVAHPENLEPFETIDGIKIIRVGGRFSHYWKAFRYFRNNCIGKFDIIIEEINTLPYFSTLYTKGEKTFYFYHQLAREVWFYQMIQPFSSVGYFFEILYTWIIGRFFGNKKNVITISQSTKSDLIKYGFSDENIEIIREGIMNIPLEKIDFSKKEKKFTVLFHSALREMKRPDHAIESFCLFLNKLSDEEKNNVQMWVSGGGPLREKCDNIVERDNAKNFIILFGRTTDEQMHDLMKRSSVLCATSVKEGWGLIVTEANSFGTPAISYDVDGLRDSTALGRGVITEATIEKMAEGLFSLYKKFNDNSSEFRKLSEYALESSKDITFDNCYSDFEKIISR